MPLAFNSVSRAVIDPSSRYCSKIILIYLRKTFLEGKTPPPQYAPVWPLIEAKTWTLDHLTDDPVLKATRFTNLIRELDRVTIWINDNIRVPYADHEHLWFMIAIGRLFNWPPTLEMLINTQGAWPSHPGFSLENVTAALEKWKAAGNKSETGAFMTRAENQPGKLWSDWPKHKYLSEIVLGGLWKERDLFQHLFRYQQPKVVRAWEWIKGHYGWGAFLSGQVTTDLRHTRYLDQAADRASWAALGPGSTKGLNLLHAAARIYVAGDPVLLLEQDRSLWDRLQIRRGLRARRKAYDLGGGGSFYTLQATIIACHTRAETAAETDWSRIAAVYLELAALVPSPVIELNRAVAVGMAEGPKAALMIVDGLRMQPALKTYHLLPSVRGDLLDKLGRHDEARAEFEAAAALAGNKREQLLLKRRAARAAAAAVSSVAM